MADDETVAKVKWHR